MNLIQIAGFLGADVEERTTGTGKRVVSLRLATRTRQGGKDDTIWWRVNIWNDRFDRMLPYLRKGTALIVVGEMSKPETYVDKNGQTQVSMTVSAEIIKFSPFGKPDKGEGQTQGDATQGQPAYAGAPAGGGDSVAFGANVGGGQALAGDDLPF